MGRILSLAIGFIMIVIMYSVFVESEKENDLNSDLRKFTLIYCIITAFALGFIINLKI